MQQLKFSLIVPTIGRDTDLERLLHSLEQQSYRNYELIIVDQNPDNRVENVLTKFEHSIPEIKHIKLNAKGASRARNEGLKHSCGDIIAFPDDDCEYASNVLAEAEKMFGNTEYDVITGIHVAEWPSFLPKVATLVPLNMHNIWTRGVVESVLFFKRAVFDHVGLFDEELGVGSGTIWGSGEGTDYLLRVLKNNFKMADCSSIIIKHEKEVFDRPNVHLKAFRYSVGRRYVLDKYKYNYFFILLNIWYPFIKLLFNFYSSKKVKYYWYQFLGRFHFARKTKI